MTLGQLLTSGSQFPYMEKVGEYIKSYCVDVRTESINICEDLEVQHIVRSAFVVIIIVIVVIYSRLKVTPGHGFGGGVKEQLQRSTLYTLLLYCLCYFFLFFF